MEIIFLFFEKILSDHLSWLLFLNNLASVLCLSIVMLFNSCHTLYISLFCNFAGLGCCRSCTEVFSSCSVSFPVLEMCFMATYYCCFWFIKCYITSIFFFKSLYTLLLNVIYVYFSFVLCLCFLLFFFCFFIIL